MTTTNTARNSAKRQRQVILAYLETGATLTQIQAGIRFNVPRLAARINELRYIGFKIESTRLKGGFVRYGLQTDTQPFEQEFFDFLKKYGGLDWYIKNRTGNLVDGQNFKLTSSVDGYIHAAFDWPNDQYGIRFRPDKKSDLKGVSIGSIDAQKKYYPEGFFELHEMLQKVFFQNTSWRI